jgi:Rrf2 family protein
MKLSTKTRYAARAMLDMALVNRGEPIPVKEIVARQEVSSKYLEQLLSALQVAGLVRSVRGRHGGYTLARRAEEITLRQIFDAMEGAEEHSAADCEQPVACVTEEVWEEMFRQMLSVLEGVTLAELARRARDRAAEAPDMYHI